MLRPPVALVSLESLQSKGPPSDSCTPPVPVFKPLELEQTPDFWLSVMGLSVSTGTCTVEENLK